MPKTTFEIFKYHLSTSNVSGRLLVINVMRNSMSCSAALGETLYLFGSCYVTYSLNFFCDNENSYSKTNWKIMFYENNSKRRAVTKAKLLSLKIKKHISVDYKHTNWYYTFFNILSGNKQVKKNLYNTMGILLSFSLSEWDSTVLHVCRLEKKHHFKWKCISSATSVFSIDIIWFL